MSSLVDEGADGGEKADENPILGGMLIRLLHSIYRHTQPKPRDTVIVFIQGRLWGRNDLLLCPPTPTDEAPRRLLLVLKVILLQTQIFANLPRALYV